MSVRASIQEVNILLQLPPDSAYFEAVRGPHHHNGRHSQPKVLLDSYQLTPLKLSPTPKLLVATMILCLPETACLKITLATTMVSVEFWIFRFIRKTVAFGI